MKKREVITQNQETMKYTNKLLTKQNKIKETHKSPDTTVGPDVIYNIPKVTSKNIAKIPTRNPLWNIYLWLCS